MFWQVKEFIPSDKQENKGMGSIVKSQQTTTDNNEENDNENDINAASSDVDMQKMDNERRLGMSMKNIQKEENNIGTNCKWVHWRKKLVCDEDEILNNVNTGTSKSDLWSKSSKVSSDKVRIGHGKNKLNGINDDERGSVVEKRIRGKEKENNLRGTSFTSGNIQQQQPKYQQHGRISNGNIPSHSMVDPSSLLLSSTESGWEAPWNEDEKKGSLSNTDMLVKAKQLRIQQVYSIYIYIALSLSLSYENMFVENYTGC